MLLDSTMDSGAQEDVHLGLLAVQAGARKNVPEHTKISGLRDQDVIPAIAVDQQESFGNLNSLDDALMFVQVLRVRDAATVKAVAMSPLGKFRKLR